MSAGDHAGENGASENGNGNVPSRRLSGFASPEYWSDDRREAQRQLAKKMNEEGRFGGRQPGAGRPRKKTVAQVVSEKAEEKADVIARELIDMATRHKAPSVKLGAIDRIITMEQNHQKNMRDDEKEVLKLSGKSLDDALAEVLAAHNIPYDYDLPPGDVEDDNGD